MTYTQAACQIVAPKSNSTLTRPRLIFKVHRFVWHVRNEGLGWTLSRIVRLARRRLVRGPQGRTPAVSRLPERTDEVLNLRPGEWVEVKSAREIADTLDANGKTRGLMFLAEMRAFCGSRFRVYKRLEKVFLEESQQNRSLKHTVLLSGAVCNGTVYGCDRSCLYYWREVWLRRVSSPEEQPNGSVLAPTDGRG